jgi:hypothetical protein
MGTETIGNYERVSLAVGFPIHAIEHLSDSFRPRRLAEGGSGSGAQQLVLARLDERGRRIVKRRGTECIFVAQIERAELRSTETGCICQYGLKHGLQIARRAGNDAQHLRGCGLPLERLREIARAQAHLIEQANVFDGDHPLIGEGPDKRDFSVAERLNLGTG